MIKLLTSPHQDTGDPCCLWLTWAPSRHASTPIIQAEIPFTNNMHEPVVFVCWEESPGGVNHAQRIMNKSLSIGNCCQGDGVPIMGHCLMCWRNDFTLGLRSVYQRNFCLDHYNLFFNKTREFKYIDGRRIKGLKSENKCPQKM